MPTADEERERLAIAIADGETIDWRAVEAAGLLPGSELRALRELAALRLPPPDLRGLAPGMVVGDFRLVAVLGEGGMGQVWEAEQLSLARRVALKFIRPERVTEHQLGLFAREARAGGRMNHPGLVTVHGHGRSDGLAWIAMELVRGARSLRDVIDEAARARVFRGDHDRRAARYAAEVADAMQVAHVAGVIHRDLKPQNVLITPEDRPKVTDFGVARIAGEEGLSRSGEPAGTYLYMSPEQLAGKRSELDARTDVFSLGVVLYELTTLRRPFEGDTSHQVAQQILGRDPPDPRTVRSRVPRDLAVIVGKALEKDRAKRFQSMEELALDLRRFLAGEPIRARPPSTLRRCVQWVRRHPARSAAAAIASIAMLVISGLLLANLEANRDLRVKSAEAEASAREAAAQATLATARADDVLRLSALQDLEDLLAAADGLWPAHPENVRAYEDWIHEARERVDELPLHRAKRAELRARALPPSGDERQDDRRDWTFPTEEREARWWNNQLTKLIDGLEELEGGLLSAEATTTRGWSVPRRLAFARGLAATFAEGGEHARAWAAALPAIHAAHPGLELAPQLGLLPLGPDPASGLWEFAHLASGAPAARGADGQLVPTEATGLVLVLLPGATFWMGGQGADPDAPNHDPQAQRDESPVHEVTLSPFFLSKYEMTQAQWLRFAGSNPSTYSVLPDPATQEQVPALLHPVEQMPWTEARRICAQLALTLPSEAQWEYAARGGTRTVWWTGDERESLRGALNIADQSAARSGYSWVEIQDWPDLDDGWDSHAPVGRYRPNPFGLHDVYGNVGEWCLDGIDEVPYPTDPQRDPVKDPAGCPLRAVRGGCFYYTATTTRSANRASRSPEFKTSEIGLRPARAITR